ncbi:MAG: hypothetical protein GY948_22940 [Alphaproteobacteria bacterium]|nr:hypothetical protein [Alphaproteobacteria bacterium]
MMKLETVIRVHQRLSIQCRDADGIRMVTACVTAFFLSIFVIVSLASQADAVVGLKVLKKEPPAGHLRSDERVLVDDASCPEGQIKLVIGGSNRVYKTNTVIPGKPRSRKCIAR